MRIGIIGTGTVGLTLGKRCAQLGHAVTYGSREPASPKAQQLLVGHPGSATVAAITTALQGELVLLAVPGAAAATAVQGWGRIPGIVVDVTNPLRPDFSGMDHPGGRSAGEAVAAALPGVRVVKAFNTIGYPIMEQPQLVAGKAFLPVCGDDAGAKRTVIQLAQAMGFDAQDSGPMAMARATEQVAMLWIHLAFAQRLGPTFAFVRSPQA